MPQPTIMHILIEYIANFRPKRSRSGPDNKQPNGIATEVMLAVNKIKFQVGLLF